MTFEEIPLNRVASVRARIGWKALTAAEYTADGYAFLNTPNIKGREIDFENTNYINQYRWDESPELQLEIGDVLLAKDGSTLGIANVVLQLPRPATVNGSIAVIRPSAVDSRFLRYCLEGSETQAEIEQLKDGMGVPHLFQRDINRLRIPHPPIAEQRRIADFLDDQVGRIDQAMLLLKTERELLEEAFESAITEFTSFGGKMAASGVPTGLPWMPRANANWPLIALRYLMKEVRVIVGTDSGSYTLLSLTKQGVIPRDIESNFGKFPASFDSYQAVEPGDLVTCLFDVDETPRTIGLAKMQGIVTGAYTRFSVNRTLVLPEFLTLLLIGIDNRKAFRPLYTGMRKGIQTGRLLGAKVPLPDLRTQEEIVRHLERRHNVLLSVDHQASVSLGLLEERKRSLITAAVTGQLDVTSARHLTGPWVSMVDTPSVESPAQAAGVAL